MKKIENGFTCLVKHFRSNPLFAELMQPLTRFSRTKFRCAAHLRYARMQGHKPQQSFGCSLCNSYGFTLAETMIVIVVLGIIATLTIPALVNKNKESVAKTKLRKAMAAYESALNKMIIENDLKSDDTLTAWAGNAENNCANSTQYFKKVQDVNGCVFKTSDGIWWDISNIERPLIAFNRDNLTSEKANAENDKTAFVLVGRFGNDGSLRVDDLAYETGNGHADQNSDKQVTKLYTFLGMKKSTAGGEQAVSCDEGDIVCKYRRGDTIPACSGENKSCINIENIEMTPGGFCIDMSSCGPRTLYIIYDKEGNMAAGYKLGTDGNGHDYKEIEFYTNSDGSHIEIKNRLDNNGNLYVKALVESDENGIHQRQYKIDENGNSVLTCDLTTKYGDENGNGYEYTETITEDCSEAALG